LLVAVRAALASVASPADAPAMQRYMKSEMPFHGVKLPVVRKVARAAFAGLVLPDRAAWEEAVRGLYFGARFREERYAALVLLGDRRAKAFRTSEALPLYEALIVEGAWWDLVDELASHFVGPLLDQPDDAKPVARAMRAWSKSDDLWKRRAAIICQLGRKERTDLALLAACIEPALGEREFFLRKAIGWALRAYAWTEPRWVRAYVKAHDAELSPLSKREALKNL
jgi:3-methyladenine DNA glycosylase AlkD